MFIAIILFFAGIYFTKIYIKDMKEQDPKEVVIDEVVGQMLAIILTSFSVIFVYSSALPQKIDATYIDFIFFFPPITTFDRYLLISKVSIFLEN